MILPELVLPSRVNKHWKFSGIDQIDLCKDKTHFLSYPHKIDYQYNSRGFRDQEWPDSIAELKSSVWCIGDSFTAGIGSPQSHTWANCLATASNQRVINVSMDGASNEWIARVVESIVNEVAPDRIVIMWSYTHRRENPNADLSSEDRRLHSVRSSVEDDWNNFLDCKNRIDSITNAVQFTIPCFHPELLELADFWNSVRGPDWPQNAPQNILELNSLPLWILSELKELHQCLDTIQRALTLLPIVVETHKLIMVNSLDISRDGHHFDLVTSEWVAGKAATRLA